MTGLICAQVPPPLCSLHFHPESMLSSPVKCGRWQTSLIMLLGSPWNRSPPKPGVERHTYTQTHAHTHQCKNMCTCMRVHRNTWAIKEGKVGTAFRTAVKSKWQSTSKARGLQPCMSHKLNEHFLLLLLLLILVWFIFIHKPKYVKLSPHLTLWNIHACFLPRRTLAKKCFCSMYLENPA